MKTYLVTGGAGFIGSNFILYMLEQHPDIQIINVDKLTYAGNLMNLKAVEEHPQYHFIQSDICDNQAMLSVFSQYTIHYVVNFAAESHVDRSILEPEAFVKTNVEGTVSLLNCAMQAWKQADGGFGDNKFLQVSTDEVYGSLGKTGYFTEKTPLDPHSPYAASKAAADLFVKSYFDTHQFPINITRCSNNYGPYQHPEKLIPLMIQNALHHKPLPVYGDGLQIRDWLYVKDHCRAIDMVIQSGQLGEAYNIGGHNECTNIDLVNKILQYLKKHVDASINASLIRHVEDRKGHDRRYGIDPEKISREVGWQPQTRYENGLEMTIRWYLDNKIWVENIVSGEYQRYYEQMYGGRENG